MTAPVVIPPTELPPTTLPLVVTTLRLPRLPITVPTVPLTVAAPSTTTSPLPVPVVVDTVHGVGPPCQAREGESFDGCFFFVYLSTATKPWANRLFSDLPMRSVARYGGAALVLIAGLTTLASSAGISLS